MKKLIITISALLMTASGVSAMNLYNVQNQTPTNDQLREMIKSEVHIAAQAEVERLAPASLNFRTQLDLTRSKLIEVSKLIEDDMLAYNITKYPALQLRSLATPRQYFEFATTDVAVGTHLTNIYQIKQYLVGEAAKTPTPQDIEKQFNFLLARVYNNIEIISYTACWMPSSDYHQAYQPSPYFYDRLYTLHYWNAFTGLFNTLLSANIKRVLDSYAFPIDRFMRENLFWCFELFLENYIHISETVYGQEGINIAVSSAKNARALLSILSEAPHYKSIVDVFVDENRRPENNYIKCDYVKSWYALTMTDSSSDHDIINLANLLKEINDPNSALNVKTLCELLAKLVDSESFCRKNAELVKNLRYFDKYGEQQKSLWRATPDEFANFILDDRTYGMKKYLPSTLNVSAFLGLWGVKYNRATTTATILNMLNTDAEERGYPNSMQSILSLDDGIYFLKAVLATKHTDLLHKNNTTLSRMLIIMSHYTPPIYDKITPIIATIIKKTTWGKTNSRSSLCVAFKLNVNTPLGKLLRLINFQFSSNCMTPSEILFLYQQQKAIYFFLNQSSVHQELMLLLFTQTARAPILIPSINFDFMAFNDCARLHSGQKEPTPFFQIKSTDSNKTIVHNDSKLTCKRCFYTE